jgi:hypothetical protein
MQSIKMLPDKKKLKMENRAKNWQRERFIMALQERWRKKKRLIDIKIFETTQPCSRIHRIFKIASSAVASELLPSLRARQPRLVMDFSMRHYRMAKNGGAKLYMLNVFLRSTWNQVRVRTI